MAPLLKQTRRLVDRRQNTEGTSPWLGIERRVGERRLASVAAGVMVAVCLAAPRPAQAQVYQWRDAKGTLVLSNRANANATRYERAAIAVVAPLKEVRVVPWRPVADYDSFIVTQAAVHGIRADLVRGVIRAESNFNPRAQSPKGAMGLMQLMPATAAELGVLDPFDALDNIRGGVAYLHGLLKRYDNNEALALAAYNAGPGAVERHGFRVPPFRETQQYVERILGSVGINRRVSVVVPARAIYKTIQIVDGIAVPHYSSSKPASGPYELVKL